MEQKMINKKAPLMSDLWFPVVGDVVRRMALLGKHRTMAPGSENSAPIASVVEGKITQAKTPPTSSSASYNSRESAAITTKVVDSESISKAPTYTYTLHEDSTIASRVHKSMPRLKIANNLTINTSFVYYDEDCKSYSSFSIPPYSVLSEKEYGESVKTCNYLYNNTTTACTTANTSAYPSDDENSVCTSSKSIEYNHPMTELEMEVPVVVPVVGKTPACSPSGKTGLLKKPEPTPLKFSFFRGMFSIRRRGAVVPSTNIQ